MQAVRGVDLAVRVGEVFALLGPNGAGKTTTVEILEGYRTRDRGEVSVLGVDPGSERARLKSRIGIVLQSTGIDRYLTVRETIAMYATFYPRPRPGDEVIHLVGLEDKRNVRVLKLSGGSSGGWMSRLPWLAIRNCCSSTSRPPASIPRPGARRGK